MRMAREEEILERIAEALENITRELESMNVHLSSLEDLSSCITEKGQFCITGDVTRYEGY